ncbi:hypothetical protein F4824DRAFT_345603 [Ustulina deusta]|nr:hypothetical protein F4824DRAFT_345603 [Ustulina deusta]
MNSTNGAEVFVLGFGYSRLAITYSMSVSLKDTGGHRLSLESVKSWWPSIFENLTHIVTVEVYFLFVTLLQIKKIRNDLLVCDLNTFCCIML